MRMRVLGLALGVAGLGGCFIDLASEDLAERHPMPESVGPEVFAPARGAPPITGGTLLVTAGGRAIAADPDRDLIWNVELTTEMVDSIPLEPGDEPGRVIAGSDGRVHVALRRGGAVVTIDPVRSTLDRRAPVCAAPRGMALDEERGSLLVACVGGDLVEIAEATGAEMRRTRLVDDLRDVVIEGEHVYVSRFRTAEVVVVNRETHETVARVRPPGLIAFRAGFLPDGSFVEREVRFTPTVAWRMVAAPDGGVLLLHQRAQASLVQVEPDPVTGSPGYGGGAGERIGGDSTCGSSIVHTTVSLIRAGQPVQTGRIFSDTVLPVDLHVRYNAGGWQEVVIAAAGNDNGPGDDPTVSMPSRQVISTELVTALAGPECGIQNHPFVEARDVGLGVPGAGGAEIVAVDHWDNLLVGQSREPAALVFMTGRQILLGGESRRDTGHAHFHRAAGAQLACASCHAEGGDDGHTWLFDGMGPRRTQTFRGGFLGTEPLHWDGSLPTFDALVDEVMVRRMGAPSIWSSHVDAIAGWMETIPTLPLDAPRDPEAVARGEALFHDPDVACATCHEGAAMTNNESVDVGTGVMLQVPSLRGLATRGPWLHDGCAQTLEERFGDCGGGDDHGLTSTLTEDQIADLVAYLETL